MFTSLAIVPMCMWYVVSLGINTTEGLTGGLFAMFQTLPISKALMCTKLFILTEVLDVCVCVYICLFVCVCVRARVCVVVVAQVIQVSVHGLPFAALWR